VSNSLTHYFERYLQSRDFWNRKNTSWHWTIRFRTNPRGILDLLFVRNVPSNNKYLEF